MTKPKNLILNLNQIESELLELARNANTLTNSDLQGAIEAQTRLAYNIGLNQRKQNQARAQQIKNSLAMDLGGSSLDLVDDIINLI